MFGKCRPLIAILASMAVIGLVTGCGSSKDHSSEWSSAQTAQMKGELSEEAPEFTDAGVECVADGVKSAFSPSEGEALDDAGREKVEGIAKGCAEKASNVQGVLSPACQEEGLISPGCEEEMINQATEEAGLGEEEDYEEAEPYGAEYEYENEGLREMNEELEQEYEEGK